MLTPVAPSARVRKNATMIVTLSAAGYSETTSSLVEADEVLLGYRDPRELGGVYDVSEQLPTLEKMAELLHEVAAEAAGR